MRTTDYEGMLRALMLQRGACHNGFRRVCQNIKLAGCVTTMIENIRYNYVYNHGDDLPQRGSDFEWLLRELKLPGFFISYNRYLEAGVPLGALNYPDRRKLIAFAQNMNTILDFLRREFYALKPSDRRRRKWTDRRKR
jgi:hypothetical protein